MYQHTFLGDNGEQLPDVVCTYGPERVLEPHAPATLGVLEGKPGAEIGRSPRA
jgi:hypothetical protein